jgi:hypothetical protein
MSNESPEIRTTVEQEAVKLLTQCLHDASDGTLRYQHPQANARIERTVRLIIDAAVAQAKVPAVFPIEAKQPPGKGA